MRMLNISSMNDLIANSMDILEPASVDAEGNERQDGNSCLLPVESQFHCFHFQIILHGYAYVWAYAYYMHIYTCSCANATCSFLCRVVGSIVILVRLYLLFAENKSSTSLQEQELPVAQW